MAIGRKQVNQTGAPVTRDMGMDEMGMDDECSMDEASMGTGMTMTDPTDKMSGMTSKTMDMDSEANMPTMGGMSMGGDWSAPNIVT